MKRRSGEPVRAKKTPWKTTQSCDTKPIIWESVRSRRWDSMEEADAYGGGDSRATGGGEDASVLVRLSGGLREYVRGRLTADIGGT